MRAVILQSNYLPWKGYFDLIQEADLFVYYDEVQYTKNDWRNRNRICSKNGVHWLTIPISRDSVRLPISEVRLPDASWQQHHLKSLTFSYRPAPYFHQIQTLLEDVYVARTWHRLVELNRYLIERIAKLLQIETTFIDSKTLALQGSRVERLVSVLAQVGATEYLTGPRARDYLAGAEPLFAAHGIRLRYKSYDRYAEYPQLATPFDHAVSVIDVLANVPLSDCRRFITAIPVV